MLLAQLCGAGNTAGRYACKSTICLHSFACKSRGHKVTSQLQIVDLQRYACSASLSSRTTFGCLLSFACTASLYKTLARLRLRLRSNPSRRLHSEAVLANRRFARVGFVKGLEPGTKTSLCEHLRSILLSNEQRDPLQKLSFH